LKAAQTARCAFMALSTARTMPKKTVNHSGKFPVFDRHAGAAQGLGVTCAIIMQRVAFRRDDDGRRHSRQAGGADRQGAPVARVIGAAQVVVSELDHRPSGQYAIPVRVLVVTLANQAIVGYRVDE
jgi:hypothetical protein